LKFLLDGQNDNYTNGLLEGTVLKPNDSCVQCVINLTGAEMN